MDQQINRASASHPPPLSVFAAADSAREHEAPGDGARTDEPRDASRGDRLAVRIARVVNRRTAGSVQNLRVEVRRDGVFLDGHCQSFYTKQLAQQAAMDLADEKPLTNRITVR